MKIRVGTRGSKLALAQTALVVEALRSLSPVPELEIVEIKTLGDRKQGTVSASHGDKKDWILDLELAILNNSIDIAVHSGKDAPADIEKGTTLHSILKRSDPRDTFIGRLDKNSGKRMKYADLKAGATIGTASLRRRASLLRLHRELQIVEHRGNVPTRMEKLDSSATLSGIVIACAGIERLGIQIEHEPYLPYDLMPAINQGTLIVQFQENRLDLKSLVQKLSHRETQASFLAERACCEILQGDCKSSISIYAQVTAENITLSSRVLSLDGSKYLEHQESASIDSARELGFSVGKQLLKMGAGQILEECRKGSR